MAKSNSPNIIQSGSSNSFDGVIDEQPQDPNRITSKFPNGFDEDDNEQQVEFNETRLEKVQRRDDSVDSNEMNP